jgi:hypothetical protein
MFPEWLTDVLPLPKRQQKTKSFLQGKLIYKIEKRQTMELLTCKIFQDCGSMRL